MANNSYDIIASGLTAQRLRMDVIASNMANINTTRTPEGGPYKRKLVVFEEKLKDTIMRNPLSGENSKADGVRVSQITQSDEPPMMVYDPTHPDADSNGYVAMPNINIVHEMTDMISASRAYEANLAALNTAKTMNLKTLDIMRF